jgi:hypothetical protein
LLGFERIQQGALRLVAELIKPCRKTTVENNEEFVGECSR